MDIALLTLIGGGILSSVTGLLGIWMTKRENTPIEDVLSTDELESYRNQRLVSEGLSFCTVGKHYYRAAPGQHERGACVDCIPPEPTVENVIERVVGQAQEGRRQPWNQRTYASPGQNAYVPVYLRPGWEDYNSNEGED